MPKVVGIKVFSTKKLQIFNAFSAANKNQQNADYGLSYGPNPNQNPLDRVGGGPEPARKDIEKTGEKSQAQSQQQIVSIFLSNIF